MSRLRIHQYDILDGRVVHRLGDSEFFCSTHGRDQMLQRNITHEEVIGTLSDPEEIFSYGENLLRLVRKFGRRRFVHISVYRKEGRMVVTTGFVKKNPSNCSLAGYKSEDNLLFKKESK